MHEINWPMIIAVYLFSAGVGTAAFFTGALANYFSNGQYNRLAKYGSYMGVPLVGLGTLMLLIDLGKPLQAWRFMINFNPSSPMSTGVWLLIFFSIITGLNALTWLAEEKFAKNSSFLSKFKNKSLRSATSLIGIPLSMLTAGYTGVLLAGTSAALWNSTFYLGLLFLISATSTGIAALMLVVKWRNKDTHAVEKLAKVDVAVILFEIAVIILLILSLNSAAPKALSVILTGSYAVWFWLGIVVCGLVIPLVIEANNVFSGKSHSANSFVLSVLVPVLILAGGFILRYVFLYAGQVSL